MFCIVFLQTHRKRIVFLKTQCLAHRFFRKHIAKQTIFLKTHRKRIVFLKTHRQTYCFSENTSLNAIFRKHIPAHRFSETTSSNVPCFPNHTSPNVSLLGENTSPNVSFFKPEKGQGDQGRVPELRLGGILIVATIPGPHERLGSEAPFRCHLCPSWCS